MPDNDSTTDQTPDFEVIDVVVEASDDHAETDLDDAVDQAKDAIGEAVDEVEDVIEAVIGNTAAEIAVRTHTSALAVRHVIGRQLVAGQELSTELFDAATEVGVALVEAPAKVLDAIGGGATLPAAFSQTGENVQEIFADAGGRIRSAIGDYVTGRAVFPSAVLSGAAEVAGVTVRAQGEVASKAVNAAFAVATVATRGGDVRDTLDIEVRELGSSARAARDRVVGSVSAARQTIRDAAAVDSSE